MAKVFYDAFKTSLLSERRSYLKHGANMFVAHCGGWWMCPCLADKPLEIYKLVTYFISLRAKLI